jgi:hypothetical protein
VYLLFPANTVTKMCPGSHPALAARGEGGEMVHFGMLSVKMGNGYSILVNR